MFIKNDWIWTTDLWYQKQMLCRLSQSGQILDGPFGHLVTVQFAFQRIVKGSRRWAVVLAQLVEQLLPTPEVCCSNPVIGKKFYWMFAVNCIEKTKIMKKRPGLAHIFLKKRIEKKLLKFTVDRRLNNLILNSTLGRRVGLMSVPYKMMIYLLARL